MELNTFGLDERIVNTFNTDINSILTMRGNVYMWQPRFANYIMSKWIDNNIPNSDKIDMYMSHLNYMNYDYPLFGVTYQVGIAQLALMVAFLKEHVREIPPLMYLVTAEISNSNINVLAALNTLHNYTSYDSADWYNVPFHMDWLMMNIEKDKNPSDEQVKYHEEIVEFNKKELAI
jgi:hypothetical protein